MSTSGAKGLALGLFRLAAIAIMCAACMIGCTAPEVSEHGGEAAPSEEGTTSSDAVKGERGLFDVRSVSPDELHKMIEDGEDVTVVDTSANRTYLAGTVPGAKNIPAGKQFAIRVEELDDAAFVVLTGLADKDLSEEISLLVERGRDADTIAVLEGGTHGWKQRGYDLEVREARTC